MKFFVFVSILLQLMCFDSVSSWQSDNGNGTYTNPILNADYPDPDIIRVGSYFYMVTSTFVNSPGITLVQSTDMVNWSFLSHIAGVVDGGPSYNMSKGVAYQGGFWAASIRYLKGTFYVAVNPTFTNGRIYYSDTPSLSGWNFHQLSVGIYDPGLFFDSDGTGYIVCGSGTNILMTLSSDYSKVVKQTNNFLQSGGEGSHVLKRNKYYYVFNAVPSVIPFQLRCSRTTGFLNSTWETIVVLIETAGGHQGAVVDIDDNDNWFGFALHDDWPLGRYPRIGPVYWSNDWPVFGTPSAPNQIASSYPKPNPKSPIIELATSDNFSLPTLGLQWQWNHNPDPSKYSLSDRPGYLRLYPTIPENPKDEFWTARNTVCQKTQAPYSQGTVKLDLSGLTVGMVVGFGVMGRVSAHFYAMSYGNGNYTIVMYVRTDQVGSNLYPTNFNFTNEIIYFRVDLDYMQTLGALSYSFDTIKWIRFGDNFALMTGYGSTWQGPQFTILSYVDSSSNFPGSGYVDIDYFSFNSYISPIIKQRDRPSIDAHTTIFR